MDPRLRLEDQGGIGRDPQEGKEIGIGIGPHGGIEIGRRMTVTVVTGTEIEEIGKGTGIENDIAREAGNVRMRGIGKEMIETVVDRLLVLVTLLRYEKEMERPRKRQEKAIYSIACTRLLRHNNSETDTRQLRRSFVPAEVY